MGTDKAADILYVGDSWGRNLARIDTLLREALDLQMAVLGADGLLVTRTLDYMGRNSFNGRQFPRAEQLFRLSARIAIPKTGEMTCARR